LNQETKRTVPAKKNITGPLVAIIICSAVFGFAAMSVVNGGLRQVPEEMSRESRETKKTTTEYTPKFDQKGDLKLEGKETSQDPKSKNSRVAVINAYLAKIPAVPKDARLLDMRMEGSTALLTFSAAIEAGYGTEDEQALVNGILATLAQFPDVRQARFMVEGKPLSSLGNIDLSQPQEVVPADSLGQDQTDSASPSTP
jgi:hypothetical protein